jgi:2',3'-cyclic-nucleotide 2'-phosphodiesterase (5'-nucleotidase family)
MLSIMTFFWTKQRLSITLLLVALVSCATSKKTVSQKTPDIPSGPRQTTPDSRVVLLFVSDLHGRLNPDDENLGGWARIAYYIKDQKNKADQQTDVVGVLGGDIAGKGSAPCVLTHDLECFALLDSLGFDLSVIGNGELKRPLSDVQKLLSKTRVPFIADNFKAKPNSNLVAPFLKYRGARSGAELVFWGWTQELMPGTYDPKKSNFEVRSELREGDLKSMQRILEGKSVIYLTHQSLEKDKVFLEKSCQYLPDQSVVLLKSNDHQEKVVATDMCVPLLEPGPYGRVLLKVTLAPKRQDTSRPWTWKVEGYEFINMDAQIPEDLALKEKIMNLYSQYAPQALTPMGQVNKDLTAEEVGQVALRAYQKTVRADLSLSNEGAFKKGLKPGALTSESLSFAIPYKEDLFGYDISHKDLEKTLCQAALREYNETQDDGSRLLTFGFKIYNATPTEPCRVEVEKKRAIYKVVVPEFLIKRSERWLGRDLRSRSFKFGVQTHRAIELELSKTKGNME